MNKAIEICGKLLFQTHRKLKQHHMLFFLLALYKGRLKKVKQAEAEVVPSSSLVDIKVEVEVQVEAQYKNSKDCH